MNIEPVRNETDRANLIAVFQKHNSTFPSDLLGAKYPFFVVYSEEETGWGNPIIVFTELSLPELESMVSALKHT